MKNVLHQSLPAAMMTQAYGDAEAVMTSNSILVINQVIHAPTRMRMILSMKDIELLNKHTSNTGTRPYVSLTNSALKLKMRHDKPEHAGPQLHIHLQHVIMGGIG